MKFLSLFAALALTFFTFSAEAKTAASACYSPTQWQAEELLRLHSELMVIAVTCRQDSDGRNLGTEYGEFTKKNINVLHDAEQTMVAYYHGSQSRLDRLRTILANEYGQKSADMGSHQFCDAYRDFVTKMEYSSSADVENEAERMKISERAYAKPCVVK